LYKDIYPGVDVRYYSEGDKLKYDFIVHPGANPYQIKMKYEGPSSVKVKNKNLIIETSLGNVTELSPFTYQQNENGERTKVNCSFVTKGQEVMFNIKGYDVSKTLIIDPAIIFSTFTGSSADNWGYTATPGPDGSFLQVVWYLLPVIWFQLAPIKPLLEVGRSNRMHLILTTLPYLSLVRMAQIVYMQPI
jgi:hypothetical protein